jgi:UDP-N-acetylglucosamine pyrophosphorylase
MPWQVTPVITPEDRATGNINRYFIKKINDAAIFEIDKTQFDAHANNIIDSNMFYTTKLIWYITGAVNDETAGAVTKQGVRSKNLTQIAFANQAMPGLAAILTNPLQFYTDNDYKVPPSIN